MSGTIMDTNLPQPGEPLVQERLEAAPPPPPPVVITPPAAESRLRRIGMAFLFWLIYLLMFGICLTLLAVFMHFAHRGRGGPVWWGVVAQIGAVLSAIIPALVMARIEKRPFGEFGLPAKNAFRRNFWVGTVWGIVSLSILMLALRGAGAFEFGTVALHGIQILKFAAYYAVFFLLTGFFEEFLVRGYSQWVLSRGLTFWPAAALLSAAFGALHGANPGESKYGLFAAAMIGFFFCLTLRRTGDLWWAVGFHMSWDWGESYFYSVPDSGGMITGHLLNSSFHGPDWLTGGSVGPEGSLLVFAVIVGLWVVFDRLYPDVKYAG